jgi:hypothetical protein
VPSDWPVYDLEADPTTCVRRDMHAVYLGHPGPDMRCPANALGRTETVLVEPLDVTVTTSGDNTAAAVNGLAVELDRGAAVEKELRVRVPGVGVAVTLTFGDSDAQAQQILMSIRPAS